MSDLRWEAADYAELQMDGEEGGGLQSVHSTRKGSFLPDYTAVDCSSLRVQGELDIDSLPPRQRAQFPSPSRLLILSVLTHSSEL